MKSLTAAGGNEVKKLVLHDALILPDSHHNLISLGILARDQHVGTWLAPGTGRSHLIFPDNVHAPLVNVPPWPSAPYREGSTFDRRYVEAVLFF